MKLRYKKARMRIGENSVFVFLCETPCVWKGVIIESESSGRVKSNDRPIIDNLTGQIHHNR